MFPARTAACAGGAAWQRQRSRAAHSSAHESFRYVHAPEFRRGAAPLPVFRQLDEDGCLAPGVVLPFTWDTARRIYECMVRSREYDTVMYEMQRQGRITFYLTNFGEEASSTASAAALSPQDMIWPQYRELGMFLWRGLTAQTVVDACIGNEGDPGRGRALPVHYMLPNANVQMVHAVLGTHVCQAPGAGYAYRIENADRIAVAYFGEGAASEGDALSALNFAALFKSQVLLICRNNGYAISTPSKEQYAGDGVAGRGPAFDIPSIRVDGNDAVAVFNATAAARAHIVTAREPVLMELMTYRLGHHTTSDDATLYRSEEELSGHRARSPILRMKRLMVAAGEWSEADDDALAKRAHGEILAAMKTGDAKKNAHPSALFADTFHDLPWHLREQQEGMLAHVSQHRDKYRVDRYRGL